MASSTSGSYPLLLLLLLAATAAAAAGEESGGGGNVTATGTSSSPTVYEMLERYDFPRGILPAGVSGYELRADGSFEAVAGPRFLTWVFKILKARPCFEVYFPRRCEFLLAGTWLVRYEPSVRGSVAAGSLTALEGISVKVLFLWIGVGEVDRAGDMLSFYVGPVATSFPLHDFAESPRCRGYDGGDSAGDDFFPAAASS